MRVAVVGATGQVGTVMLAILDERGFPLDDLRLLASSRSAGRRIPFRGDDVVVEDVATADVDGLDLALFSVGSAASAEWRPEVRRRRGRGRRQFVGVADGSRRPVGGARSQSGRTGVDPEGHRGQPQLHDHGGHAGAQAAP